MITDDAADQLAAAYVAFMETGDERLLELIAPEFFDHVSGRTGPDIWNVVRRWLDESFANRTVDLHAVMHDADRVIVWVTVHGTHVGSGFPWLRARPAQDKHVEWKQVHVFRVVGGLATEHWAVRDDLRVLEAIDGD